MNSLKSILYTVLAILCLLLVQFWLQETSTHKAPETQISQTKAPKIVKSLDQKQPKKEQLVALESPDISVQIDLVGGKIVKTELTNYFKTIARKQHQTLLNYGADYQYYAQSGFLGDESVVYAVDSKSSNQNRLVLTGQSGALKYSKIFEFDSEPYTVKQTSEVENIGVVNQTVNNYSAFISLHNPNKNVMDTPKTFEPGSGKAASSGWFVLPTYAGVSYHTDAQSYVKLPYTQIAKQPGSIELEKAGWFSLQHRYFLNAWVPSELAASSLNTRWLEADDNGLSRFSVSMIGQPQQLASNEKSSQVERLYSGPELADVLKAVSPGLNLTIDYGWLWLLSELIFNVLTMLHMVFNNWGVAIILTTTLIKVLFYKLSEKGFVASLRMKAIQPRIKELQERYKDDAVQKNQAVMEIYKKEGVNPMGGCLPILIQFPFLIALYWVLIESVQLRHASFLWIPDLSAYDPYYILPLVMGVGLFFQQKLTPTNMDPAQENAMMIMPIMMTFLFCQFPAGLALYMLTNAVLSAAQQWYLTQKHK